MQAGRRAIKSWLLVQFMSTELTVQKKLKVLADTISLYGAYCAKNFEA